MLTEAERAEPFVPFVPFVWDRYVPAEDHQGQMYRWRWCRACEWSGREKKGGE